MNFRIAGFCSLEGVLYRTVGTCKDTGKQRWIRHSDDPVAVKFDVANLSELLAFGAKLKNTPFSQNSVILSKEEWLKWKKLQQNT